MSVKSEGNVESEPDLKRSFLLDENDSDEAIEEQIAQGKLPPSASRRKRTLLQLANEDNDDDEGSAESDEDKPSKPLNSRPQTARNKDDKFSVK
jgi:hypothetical protein